LFSWQEKQLQVKVNRQVVLLASSPKSSEARLPAAGVMLLCKPFNQAQLGYLEGCMLMLRRPGAIMPRHLPSVL